MNSTALYARDYQSAGSVNVLGGVPTLILAAIATTWLRGLRFSIARPVRRPAA